MAIAFDIFSSFFPKAHRRPPDFLFFVVKFLSTLKGLYLIKLFRGAEVQQRTFGEPHPLRTAQPDVDGGLIGGVIAFGLQVRHKKLPMATMYDGAAPAIANALSFAIECDVDDLSASTEKAIYLSIIVNELVTNALKHAFQEGAGGVIRVSSEPRPDGVAIIVEDDGAGINRERVLQVARDRLAKFLSRLRENGIVASGMVGEDAASSHLVALIRHEEEPHGEALRGLPRRADARLVGGALGGIIVHCRRGHAGRHFRATVARVD